MAYLDNIIIYFKNEQDHKNHIECVVKRLYKEQIPIAIKKCEFFIIKIEFIGFIIKLSQI